jgi:hypothetical protein
VFLGETKIPDAHILKRWTRDARDVLPSHLIMYQKDTPAMHSKTFRHSLLHVNAMELVKLGDTNLDTFKEMMKHFAASQKAVKGIIHAMGEPAVEEPFPNYESSDAEWHRNRAVGYQSEPDILIQGSMQYGLSGSSAGMTAAELCSINAPLLVRKRGRPRQNRFLSPWNQRARGSIQGLNKDMSGKLNSAPNAENPDTKWQPVPKTPMQENRRGSEQIAAFGECPDTSQTNVTRRLQL